MYHITIEVILLIHTMCLCDSYYIVIYHINNKNKIIAINRIFLKYNNDIMTI